MGQLTSTKENPKITIGLVLSKVAMGIFAAIHFYYPSDETLKTTFVCWSSFEGITACIVFAYILFRDRASWKGRVVAYFKMRVSEMRSTASIICISFHFIFWFIFLCELSFVTMCWFKIHTGNDDSSQKRSEEFFSSSATYQLFMFLSVFFSGHFWYRNVLPCFSKIRRKGSEKEIKLWEV